MLKQIEIYFRQKRYHEIPERSNTGVPFLIGTGVLCDASDLVTIKGEMFAPVTGEHYRLWGEWEKESEKYGGGQSFRFYSYEVLINDTIDGISDYLERYVDELGPIRSREIVNHFGASQCLKILREIPERVSEVPGIGPKTAEQIKHHFTEEICPVDPAAYASIYNLLAEFSPPKKVIQDILYDFKSSSLDIIRANPYLLLNYAGLGWKKVDQIAKKKLKYDSNGIDRVKAGIMESLQQVASDGDTVIDLGSLEVRMSRDLNVKISNEAIQQLIFDGFVSVQSIEDPKGRKRKHVSILSVLNDEQEIAWRLRGLIDSWSNPNIEIDTNGLEEEQIEACKFIENHGVCLLIGPPGTGKTTSITKVIQTLHGHGHSIMVVAPTGKAAKRASEVLNQWIPNNSIQVSTIHRALEPAFAANPLGVPEEHAKFNRGRERFCFLRNEENPLEADVIVVDESSMIDVELFAQLLRAIPPGCRLIMVGDENQLPSVGPGACLRDMIAAGIPHFSLTKPRRNSGRIVLACHAIKDGKIPKPSPQFSPPLENWFHFEEPNPVKMAEIMVQLHGPDFTDRDPFNDIQVISPQNDDLPIACANLNKLLSRKLNPARHQFDANNQEAKYGPGDKIVRTKNGFVTLMEKSCVEDEDFSLNDKTIYWNNKTYYLSKTYVVNGDIGQVIALEKFDGKRYAIVQFKNPDKLCLLPASEAYITLAYAMTVHKAQGSGFNLVILPLYDFYWNERNKSGLWTRELIYTMLSRGIDAVITVGKLSSLGSAVRNKTIHRRQTCLARFIQKELSDASPASQASLNQD